MAISEGGTVLGLLMLAAVLGGAGAGWLAATLATPRPVADALERLSLRLAEQAEALRQAEATGLAQIEAAEAERHRFRAAMTDAAGVLARMAEAQAGAEAGAERRLQSLRSRAAAGIRGLALRIDRAEARLAALERAPAATHAPALPSSAGAASARSDAALPDAARLAAPPGTPPDARVADPVATPEATVGHAAGAVTAQTMPADAVPAEAVPAAAHRPGSALGELDLPPRVVAMVSR